MVSGPDTILANTIRGWGRDPKAYLAGTAKTGVSAALWNGYDDSEIEVSGDPDSTQHIVSVQLTSFSAEMFIDRKLHYRIKHRTGSSSIVRAGEEPRAIISGNWKVLHVYVPTKLIWAIAESEELLTRPNEIELVCHRGTLDLEITRIGQQILAETRQELPFSQLRVDALSHDLVIHLLRARSNLAAASLSNRGGGLAPWQLRRVHEMMYEFGQPEVALGVLANATGLSPFHFLRAFKTSTGVPPHRYLVQLRIEKARELLETTDLPIGEIAAQVGYDDPSYLARLFRREVGVTPAAYRRERRR